MKVLFASLTKHDEPLGIMYLSSALKFKAPKMVLDFINKTVKAY